LIRAITASIALAFCCIAATALGASVVTPAPTWAISGRAFTVSLTLSSTTGPCAWIWTSAATAGEARTVAANSGKA